VNVAFGHTNMDLDCLGSLILIKKLFPTYVLVRSRMIHPAAYSLFNLYENHFGFIEARDMEGQTIENIIVVDTSRAERLKEYFNFIRGPAPEITIYDHHLSESCDILGARFVGFPFGANTSGLGRLARERGITLSSEEATIALTGIYADTGRLIYENTRREDLEAAAWLIERGASLQLVKSFLEAIKEDQQIETLNRLLPLTRNVNIQGNELLLSYLELDEQVAGLAAVVEKVMDVKNPDAFFAVFFVRKNRTALVIARSGKPRIDLHELLAPYGGGGHQAAGSAKICGVDGPKFYAEFTGYLERSLTPAMCAADIMTREVFTVDENATLLEASLRMEEVNHTGLPVLNGAGELVGFLTLKEIMKGRRSAQMASPVKAYMIRGVVSAGPAITLREIERLFYKHHIGHLPILEGRRLAGIVSRRDYLECTMHPAGARADGG
jgi:tRNA nucleotidyltransferase (CCA-adding enzyme)